MIGPGRKAVQWSASLLVLVLPFLRMGGESLLRLDAGTRTLIFFGARVRIEEFHLFLVAVLILVFLFLLLTMVLGRVWCGWLCPQTTLSDLTEWIDRGIRRIASGRGAKCLSHLSYLAVSFVVASNLIWYFIPPGEFLQRLASGRLGMVAGITLATSFILLYLDLALVRRLFCKTVCPYGRFQMMTTDRNTLTLEFDPALRGRCLECGACRRSCPMGIDIREGLQIECINCGRCLDACRGVMNRRGADGLIHYTFGSRAHGGGHPLNVRSLLLSAVVLLFCGILAYGVATREEATLKVRQGALGKGVAVGGAVVNFYEGYLENRGVDAAVFALRVPSPGDQRAEIIGPVTELHLAANANQRVDFAVRLSPPPAATLRLKLELVRNGTVVAETPLPFLAAR